MSWLTNKRRLAECGLSSKVSLYSLSTMVRLLTALIVLIVIDGLILYALAVDATDESGHKEDVTASIESIEKRVSSACHDAADYLCAKVLPNGQFVYRINMDERVVVRPRYNILRHAGTIYSLGMYNEVFPSQEAETVITKANGFLRSQIAALPGFPDISAVWSDPRINGRPVPMQAKLGGTGLGLVALLTEEKIRPGATDLQTLKELGNFLVMMQRSDGSFYSKYIPDEAGFDDWISLYYPGEAALGLAMLYEVDSDEKWLTSALAAMEFLALERKGKVQVPHDHWALLATARLLKHVSAKERPELHGRLLSHAFQICHSILHAQKPYQRDSILYGSFDRKGRVTPCATRLEGLLAVLAFLPPEQEDLKKSVRLASDQGIDFLLKAQVREGEHKGGFPRSIFGSPAYKDLTSYPSDPRNTEIRVDYVQHALSAMLQYRQILVSER